MRRRPRSMTTFASGPAAFTIAMPGSDVFAFDLFHARRGLVGGTLSRCYFVVVASGTTRVYSFQHNGSRANPTVHVPSLSTASHRYVDLGSSVNTATQVVAACIASLALDGITATDNGADSSGRRLLRITGVTSVSLPAAVATDNRERGMWGLQRDHWGAGAAATLNADGGTTGTGSIHLGNPNSQSGMSGRTGRVLGVYLWANGNFPPRLAAFTGPAYSTTPTALTTLGEAVSAAINGPGFGGVLFDAAAFGASANLWAAYRDNTVGGPRYRLHAQTPVGRGDQGLNQFLVWDTVASSSNATAFGASYTPTSSSTFGIYVSIGVIYELQDANGRYPADGSIDTWVGDQNTTPAHGTIFSAGPALLDNETTHHRFTLPNWTNYGSTQYRRAYGAIGADEDSRIAFYGPWASLAFPASPAPALIRDAGILGAAGRSNLYTTMTFGTRVELGTEVLGTAPIVSVGSNYHRAGGLANNVITLPVYLDISTGDSSWLDCWVDTRTEWHDDIIGASGSRAFASGVSEYRTISTPGMPIAAPADTFPNPMAVAAGNDSPNAIAGEAYRVQRSGMAVA